MPAVGLNVAMLRVKHVVITVRNVHPRGSLNVLSQCYNNPFIRFIRCPAGKISHLNHRTVQEKLLGHQKHKESFSETMIMYTKIHLDFVLKVLGGLTD